MNSTVVFQEHYEALIGWTSNITLILIGWFVFDFLLLLLGIEQGLKKIYGDKFTGMSIEKQRATTFQTLDTLLLGSMLLFSATLLIKKHIIGDYPDIIGVQGERVFAVYMLIEYIIELIYRTQLRLPMIIHHIGAIINIGIALHIKELWTRTYFYLLGMIAFMTCMTFIKSFAFVVYRLYPKHERTFRLITAVMYQELFCKILLQFLNGAILIGGVLNGDFGTSVVRYILMFGSFVLFMPIQFYNVYVLYQVRNKMIARRKQDTTTTTIIPKIDRQLSSETLRRRSIEISSGIRS